MANFDYRKAIKENKATFFSSLTEGQFSWMTQDTDNQIGSEPENTITVYMHDNKGNTWREDNYQGYGEFGGMDYYELLAKMNGYTEDDIERLSNSNVISFPELRNIGVKVAFGDLKPLIAGPVLFPALTENPRYPSGHDFTEEAKNDPNQSWYNPEEEEDDDDNYSWEDQYGDDEEIDEGKDEMSAEEKANVFVREEKKSNKMKKSELKTKIKEQPNLFKKGDKVNYDGEKNLIVNILKDGSPVLVPMSSIDDEAFSVDSDEIRNPKLYAKVNYDDEKHLIVNILKDGSPVLVPMSVIDDEAFSIDSDEIETPVTEASKNKMTKKELKEIIKAAIMNEGELEIGNMEDAPESEVDFLSETNNPKVWKMFDLIRDNMDDDQFLQELIAAMDTNEAIANLEHIIQMYDLEDYGSLREAEEEEVETEEEVDVDVEEPTPSDEPKGGIDVTQNADADLTGVEKEVQDNLEAAMEAAKKLNDEKLQQQIGNSLTFFTRQHVVKENNKKYYKDAEADDAEHIKALEKDMKDDKKSSEKLQEAMFPMLKKILK